MLILDGKASAQSVKDKIKKDVESLIHEGKRPPHLAAILIGNNPASQAYVGNKVKTCKELGFESTLITRDDISEKDLLSLINDLNNNDGIDGILVQLPLPKHIDEQKVILAIDPDKDVDGFHPINVGQMAIGKPKYIPATPYGILLMLSHYQIETTGKHCVIIGRSNIVGTPMSILLSRNSNPGNCTVTLCHSRTNNLKEILLQADIIIAAIGIPHFVKADMVKENAVVIDVGINSIPDETKKSGHRLVGDVDYDALYDRVIAMTPVPGGVGPMTIAGLMQNTLHSRMTKS